MFASDSAHTYAHMHTQSNGCIHKEMAALRRTIANVITWDLALTLIRASHSKHCDGT